MNRKALPDLSLASPPYTPPFLVDPGEEYPYSRIHGRELEQRVLRDWLLGTEPAMQGDSSAASIQPLGGAALVTGFRGVGKTTFVKKVLFDVAVAGFYQLLPGSENPVDGWGPFAVSIEDLGRRIRRHEKQPSRENATLFIPIHLDVANPITAAALMHRLMRRTYLKLVQYQIGEFRPDILRKARLGYMRTLGKLDVEVSAKFRETLGVSLDALAKLEVTASQEMEFAESMKLAAEGLSVEEAEDEILDIGEILSAIRLGEAASLPSQVGQALSGKVTAGLKRLRTLFQGDSGRRVHLVYVFDELDKLQRFETGEQGGQRSSEAQGHPDPSRLRLALEMIQQLKTLFSTHNISAIVIGGIGLERQWAEEMGGADPLLRSIFSRHVYVPQIKLDVVEELLGDFATKELDTAAVAQYLAFVSQGRYKQLLRDIGHLRTTGQLPALANHLAPVIVSIAGAWDTADIRSQHVPDIIQSIKSAADLESLTQTIVESGLPPQLSTEFGLDIVHSFLVGATIQQLNPLFTNDLTEQQEWLERVVAEYSRFGAPGMLSTTLERVAQLISAARSSGDPGGSVSADGGS